MSKDFEPRVLGHADEADGIEEYDNPLPDWWVGLFWLTIVWAIGYTVHYHFIADRSQVSDLAAEMAAADARWPAQAQAELQFAMSDQAVTAGETVYGSNCFPCHGVNLEGGIGPSFIDAEWIHGGQAQNIVRTIREGVPTAGMVAWGGILSPEQINDVAAYVIAKHSEATGRSIEDILAPPTDEDASDGAASGDESEAEPGGESGPGAGTDSGGDSGGDPATDAGAASAAGELEKD